MAAKITGPVLASQGVLGSVYTSEIVPLGTVVAGEDDFGNTAEFIFLAGCASTIVSSVVTYDENGATALLAANAKGPVAVALAITDSTSEYGWYARSGCFYVDTVANSADNANLGRETTDGKVGDGFAAGDLIANMISRGSTTSAALQYAQFNRPFVNDQMGS